MDGNAIAKPIEPNGNGAGENRKLGSEQPNGSGKPFRAVVGVSGVIDPTLARTTAGGDPKPVIGNTAGNPAGNANGTDASTVKRGRGRPPGPNAKPKPDNDKAEASNLELDGIEAILFSIHAVVAATVNVPELELDEKEAAKLARAIEKVGEQYVIKLTPKQKALMDLGRVASVIYMPRAVSVFLRAKASRKTVAATAPAPTPTEKQEPAGVPLPTGFDPTKIRLN